MASDPDTAARIIHVLKRSPAGLTITDIAQRVQLNRNSTAKYLDMLLVSGQVEMQSYGTARVFSASKRLPLQTILSYSTEYLLVLNRHLRIVQINDPFLEFCRQDRENLIGEDFRTVDIPIITSPVLSSRIQGALESEAPMVVFDCSYGEESLYFRGKIYPTVFEDGERGVTIVLEDVTAEKKAEIALQSSEERFRRIVERTYDGIVSLNRKGEITFASPSITCILGYTPDELHGRDCRNYIPEERHQALEVAARRLLSGEELQFPDMQTIRKDGTIGFCEAFACPIIENKEIVGIQVVGRDITERRRAQEMQSFLAALIESSDDAIIGESPDGRILSWNAGAERIYGYTREEAASQPISLLVPPDMMDELLMLRKNVRKGRRVDRFESVRRHKDGRLIDVAITLSPILDSNGAMIGISTINRDITEQVKIRKEQQKSEETIRALLNASAYSAILTDTEGNILASNDMGVAHLGCRSLYEILGMPIQDFFSVENSRYIEMQAIEPARMKMPITFQKEIDDRVFLVTIHPITDRIGEVIQFAVYSEDITRKLGEQSISARACGTEDSR